MGCGPSERRTTMIYMVEMDFPHPERLAEWHEWYLAHIRVLLTVPGFRASQRFQAIIDGRRRPIWRCTRSPRRRCSKAPNTAARGGPASTGEWQRAANQLAPQPARRARRDARGACRQVSRRAARRARRRVAGGRADLRGCAGSVSTARSANAASQWSRDPVPLVEIARRDERVRLYRPISEKIRAAAAP